MRTTTVKWAKVPGYTGEQALADKLKAEEAAAALAGETYRAGLNKVIDEENNLLIFSRAWPDLATAEAWVAYALREGALSAEVDPE